MSPIKKTFILNSSKVLSIKVKSVFLNSHINRRVSSITFYLTPCHSSHISALLIPLFKTEQQLLSIKVTSRTPIRHYLIFRSPTTHSTWVDGLVAKQALILFIYLSIRRTRKLTAFIIPCSWLNSFYFQNTPNELIKFIEGILILMEMRGVPPALCAFQATSLRTLHRSLLSLAFNSPFYHHTKKPLPGGCGFLHDGDEGS